MTKLSTVCIFNRLVGGSKTSSPACSYTEGYHRKYVGIRYYVE